MLYFGTTCGKKSYAILQPKNIEEKSLKNFEKFPGVAEQHAKKKLAWG